MVSDLVFMLNLISFALLIAVVRSYLNFEQLIHKLSIFIAVCTAAVTLIGILQSFEIHILTIPLVTPPGSTLLSRPFTAEYIAAAIPFCILAIILSKRIIYQVLFVMVLLATVYYLGILRGRAGFVAFTASMTVVTVLILMYHNGVSLIAKNLKYGFAAIVLFSLVIFVASKDLPGLSRHSLKETILAINPFKTHEDQRLNENINKRFRYWSASLEMFYESPMLGIGTSKWAGVYPAYFGEDVRDSNAYLLNINPHNDLIEYLAENGLFSFLAYLWLIAYSLIIFWGRAKNNRSYVFLAASFTAIMVASMFSFTKDRTAPMMLCFILFGLAMIGNSNTMKIPSRYIAAAVLPILLLNTIFLWVRINSEKSYIEAIQFKFREDYNGMLKKFDETNTFAYKVDANLVPLDYYRGVGYYETTRFEEAYASFTDALRYAPESPLILANIAAARYQLGQRDQALALLKKLELKFPNYFQPQLNLLALYVNEGRHGEAAELLRSIEAKQNEYHIFRERHHWNNHLSFEQHVKNQYLYIEIKDLLQKQRLYDAN